MWRKNWPQMDFFWCLCTVWGRRERRSSFSSYKITNPVTRSPAFWPSFNPHYLSKTSSWNTIRLEIRDSTTNLVKGALHKHSIYNKTSKDWGWGGHEKDMWEVYLCSKMRYEIFFRELRNKWPNFIFIYISV